MLPPSFKSTTTRYGFFADSAVLLFQKQTALAQNNRCQTTYTPNEIQRLLHHAELFQYMLHTSTYFDKIRGARISMCVAIRKRDAFCAIRRFTGDMLPHSSL
jgi:hypothetical protein